MSEWQPIETAPKDGTRIDVWLGDASKDDLLFYCHDGSKRSIDWYWKNGKFRPYMPGKHIASCFVIPTHWKPISEPPKKQNNE